MVDPRNSIRITKVNGVSDVREEVEIQPEPTRISEKAEEGEGDEKRASNASGAGADGGDGGDGAGGDGEEKNEGENEFNKKDEGESFVFDKLLDFQKSKRSGSEGVKLLSSLA